MNGFSVRPTFESFCQQAQSHRHVPVVATLVSDDLTPVGAFQRIADRAARAFLLESVIGGEKIARYSFLGAGPAASITARGERVEIVDHVIGQSVVMDAADPLAVVHDRLAAYRAAAFPGLPRFLGGAVGYAGYDAIRYYERLPAAPRDDRRLPDVAFDLYESLVVFDHVFKRVHVVAHADVGAAAGPDALRTAYHAARAQIDALIARLTQPQAIRAVSLPATLPETTQFTSNFERAAFERAVEACQEYIRAGDIFQVVLSQRLAVETRAAPFDIYRAARVINPSPFMFYLKSPEVILVGASPEIMCRVEDGVVTNRPLAGTRPRGANDAEDRRLREELLVDAKERAEHVMLVDLGRNDLGRVCKAGSVQLPELMAVENYSHVMHISSTVVGELREELNAFDALRATLPVGTVSGAPKVRAMQIIDELEPTRRGPYAGAIGYVDFAGNMDTCIGLRTLVVQPTPGGGHTAYMQAGAGVVADSVPAKEYEETMNKAKAMLTAIAVAEQCFGAE